MSKLRTAQQWEAFTAFNSKVGKLRKSFFRIFGELYMEDYDTGKQDFDDNKVCLENVSNGNYSWVEFHFANTFLSHGGFYRHFGKDIFSVFVCSLSDSDHWIQPCDSLLEGQDRCPNLDEKSFAQFAFRVVLYLVIFTINVILVNILIGQISKTLERVMREDDKDYHMNVLELKAGFISHSLRYLV